MCLFLCLQDRSVCVWHMDSGRVRCVARGYSHTNAVGSISCSRYHCLCFNTLKPHISNQQKTKLPPVCVFRIKASFVVSGSLDCTVKVWDLPADLTAAEDNIHQLTPRTTEKAHDKVLSQNSVERRIFILGRRAVSAVIRSLCALG